MPDYDGCLDEGIKADKTGAMLAVIAQNHRHGQPLAPRRLSQRAASTASEAEMEPRRLAHAPAGKRRKEAGAQAGFSASELLAMTRTAFGRSRDLSTTYYRALYPHHAGKVVALDRSGRRSPTPASTSAASG